jgi:hypothetical protein
MARNRKYRTVANRFGPAIKAFLLCSLLCGSGVGYVWQKDQIGKLDRQLKERETRLKRLEDENDKRRQELARLRSPAALEAQIKKWNLGLGPPQLSQILRLTEPSSSAPVVRHERQYVLEDKRVPLAPQVSGR